MSEGAELKFVLSLFRVPTDAYLDVARAAEAAGFEAIGLSDHIVHIDEVASRFPYSADGERPWDATDDYPDVWVATAMMAAVTHRLRFLQAIYVLPARDPFSTAKALGTLARMSGNRVSLGFGVGWMREEFELMGQAFDRRGARAEEMIALMQRLWSGESVDHSGEFYQLEGVRMRPAVEEKIPIVCSGENPAALRRAARIGDGWIAPISVATPEALEAKIQEIASHRREARREEIPFSVYWTLGDAPNPADVARLRRMGVTHVFAAPWAFEDADGLSIDERLAEIERFGHEVITRAADGS
jgi:probable F420-dependent oxidoreductase